MFILVQHQSFDHVSKQYEIHKYSPGLLVFSVPDNLVNIFLETQIGVIFTGRIQTITDAKSDEINEETFLSRFHNPQEDLGIKVMLGNELPLMTYYARDRNSIGQVNFNEMTHCASTYYYKAELGTYIAECNYPLSFNVARSLANKEYENRITIENYILFGTLMGKIILNEEGKYVDLVNEPAATIKKLECGKYLIESEIDETNKFTIRPWETAKYLESFMEFEKRDKSFRNPELDLRRYLGDRNK